MFHPHTSCIEWRKATDSRRALFVCHKYLCYFTAVAVVTFVTVASPTTALGDTITLSSSADTFVNEAYPSTNYGTIIDSIGVSGQAGYRVRAYVKFSLSSIPSGEHHRLRDSQTVLPSLLHWRWKSDIGLAKVSGRFLDGNRTYVE